MPDRVAFADSRHALAIAGRGTCNGDHPELVQRSDDAGLSWNAAGSIPDFGAAGTAIAVAGRLAVAVGGGCGGRIAISADDARTWSVRAVRSPLIVSSVAVRGHELWVLCNVNTPYGGRTTILHSTNAGRTWRAERFPDPITVQALVATGHGQATAMLADAFDNATFGSPDASLWRTTDGGASWTQSWPALPLGPRSTSESHASVAQAPGCAPSRLRLRAGAQGTATQAVVFATLIDRGPPCSLSGSMHMTIEHDGKPATDVHGNPAVFVLAGRRAGRSVVVMPSFWWGNWCGGPRGFTGVVTYDGLVQQFRWPVLPDCISRGEGSSVAAVWWG